MPHTTLLLRLTPASLEEVLRRFPPRFSQVIADHITFRYDAPDNGPLPPWPNEVRVIGYAADEALECLVAEVDGTSTRHDGGTYHITLSLEPDQREAKDSNTVLQSGWEARDEFEVEVVPDRKVSRG